LQAGGRRFEPAWLHHNPDPALGGRTERKPLRRARPGPRAVARRLGSNRRRAPTVGVVDPKVVLKCGSSLTMWKVRCREGGIGRSRRAEAAGPSRRRLARAGMERSAARIRPQGLGLAGQATKRMRWMPWRPQATKDVAACEKLRGAGNQALSRRSLNGETHPRGYPFLNS
jgi:hypothetical protein